MFLTALLVGLAASSALVIGGSIGAFVKPSQKVVAVLLGFAAGALITALAFDLFEEAFSIAGPWLAGAASLSGRWCSWGPPPCWTATLAVLRVSTCWRA